MCGGGKGGNSQAIYLQQQQADEARVKEEERQQRIRDGLQRIDQQFAGFDDRFYDQRAQQVTDYYMPQYQDQYEQARREMVYNLARAGISGSASADLNARLERDAAIARGDIANRAATARGELQSQVADQRGQLERELQASSDSDLAAQNATSRVMQFRSSTPDLSPLSAVLQGINYAAGNYARGQAAGESQRLVRDAATLYSPSTATVRR